MAEKVGIRFRPCGKLYFFQVNGDDIQKGDSVVVESSFGMTIGHVVTERLPVAGQEKELKKILRKTTEKDVKKKEDNTALEKESRAFCLERIHARGLPMKLVSTEVTLDKKRIIFYFTADGRIDFRELVKDLAAKFKTRIEMRQIGVRDETKLVGGIGICGREVCCRTFLTGFTPVSIKMAKKQELVLNTNKLSGVCGRLMCCLGYEAEPGKLKRDVDISDSDEDGIREEGFEEFALEKETDVNTGKGPVSGDEAPSDTTKKTDRKKKPSAPSREHDDKTKEAVGERKEPESKDQKADEKKRRRSRKFHRSKKRRKKKK